jgi:hypothetical protein
MNTGFVAARPKMKAEPQHHLHLSAQAALDQINGGAPAVMPEEVNEVPKQAVDELAILARVAEAVAPLPVERRRLLLRLLGNLL